MGVGLLKRTGRWKKGIDKIQTARRGHPDPTCTGARCTGRGVAYREGRGIGRGRAIGRPA